MDEKDKNRQHEIWWPDDVIFVSDEIIRAFERAEFKMWQARQELRNVAESMKECGSCIKLVGNNNPNYQ